MEYSNFNLFVTERHTGDYLASVITKVLQDFEIDKDKISLLIRDGASNMVKTALILGIDSQQCFAHLLQLVSHMPRPIIR